MRISIYAPNYEFSASQDSMFFSCLCINTQIEHEQSTCPPTYLPTSPPPCNSPVPTTVRCPWHTVPMMQHWHMFFVDVYIFLSKKIIIKNTWFFAIFGKFYSTTAGFVHQKEIKNDNSLVIGENVKMRNFSKLNSFPHKTQNMTKIAEIGLILPKTRKVLCCVHPPCLVCLWIIWRMTGTHYIVWRIFWPYTSNLCPALDGFSIGQNPVKMGHKQTEKKCGKCVWG